MSDIIKFPTVDNELVLRAQLSGTIIEPPKLAVRRTTCCQCRQPAPANELIAYGRCEDCFTSYPGLSQTESPNRLTISQRLRLTNG